jgi:hypothetical protein
VVAQDNKKFKADLHVLEEEKPYTESFSDS